MGLFSKKKTFSGDKEIDDIINGIRVDLSNNYKDNAVLGIKKLKAVVEEKHDSGKLRDNLYTRYADIIKEFETDVAGFKRTY